MNVRLCGLLTLAALVTGCAAEPGQMVAYPVPIYETRVEVRPETRIVMQPTVAPTSTGHQELAVEPPPRAPRSDILVTTSKDIGRPTQVVGIVDTHEPSGRQDIAFSSLRERATAIGADAVVGVEFHHGESEGKDDPTHFSGLAVRFINH